MTTLLEVENLKIKFKKGKDYITTVNNVNFYIKEGETVGIVGESGCGKSVTSLSIMGLLPTNVSTLGEESKIFYSNKSLLDLSPAEIRSLRGREIAMIFQDPMTSLNPVLTIGYQMIELLMAHFKMKKNVAKDKCIQMLKKVEIPRAEKVINNYPHQLSGGMRQRVMIAIALLCEPKLIIADEPTTALDVTTQAQILELMNNLQNELGTSIMFITHDLGVVAETCDRVIVMYAGEIIEEGLLEDIFNHPKHPYTLGLLDSIPDLEMNEERLKPIPGYVPTPENMPKGCRFASRCKFATNKCVEFTPPQVKINSNHFTRCWLHTGEGV